MKLTTGRVGRGFSQEPGEVIDVPDTEGRRLVATLQAEPVEEIRSAGQRPAGNQPKR